MFFDSWGLLNSRPDEVNAENALLWTFEYTLLMETLALDSSAPKEALKQAIRACRTPIPGIYHQNPQFSLIPPTVAKDAYMSPDQLLAICGFSYKVGNDDHLLVWKEIKRQHLLYDNVLPFRPTRLIHPKDLIFYGYLSGSFICKLLFPIFLITCILPHFKPVEDTSTKILSFVRLKLVKNNNIFSRLTCKIVNFLVKRKHQNWNNIFQIYFPNTEHPIHKLMNTGIVDV